MSPVKVIAAALRVPELENQSPVPVTEDPPPDEGAQAGAPDTTVKT
jgi:hypothetical protein